MKPVSVSRALICFDDTIARPGAMVWSYFDGVPVDRFEQKNYCSSMKVRDIVTLIEKGGWYWVRTRGSHHQYKHPTKPGLVTIPGTPGDDVAPGTLNNILKQAGLKP